MPPRARKRRRTELPPIPTLPEIPEMPTLETDDQSNEQSNNESNNQSNSQSNNQSNNSSVGFSTTDYNDSAAAEMNSALETFNQFPSLPQSSSSQSSNQSNNQPKRRGRKVGATLTALPADLERRMGEANTAFIGEDYDRAINILLNIIKQSPTSIAPYHTLCLIYEAQSDKSKVLDTTVLLSKLDEKDASTWSRIAQLSFELDKLDQALDAANKAIKLNSTDQSSQEIRALIWIEHKDWVKAAGAVGNLMQSGNQSPVLSYYMAQCYYHTGQLEKALTLLEEYLNNWKVKQAIKQSNIQSVQPKPKTGNFLLDFDEMEDDDQSGQSYETPEVDLNVFEMLASIYDSSHRYDSIMSLIDAIHIDYPFQSLPLSMQVHYAIALIHVGQFQRASLLLNTLWDSDSAEAPSLIFKVAEAYTNTGHLQSAFNAYSSIEHVEPYKSMSDLWLRQAACLRALGTTEKEAQDCLALYERVSRADPNNLEARIGRIDLCRELGLDSPEIEYDPTSLAASQTKRRRVTRKTNDMDSTDPTAQAKAVMNAVAKAMGDVARSTKSVWRPAPDEEERVVLDESVFECGFFETSGQLSLLVDRCNELLRDDKQDEYYALLFPIVDNTLNIASGYTNMLPDLPTADESRVMRIATMETLLTVESFGMIDTLLSVMLQNGEYSNGVNIVTRIDSILRRRYDIPAMCWRMIHARLRILGARLAVRAYRHSETTGDLVGDQSFLSQACFWLRKCYVQENNSRKPSLVLFAVSVLHLTSYRGKILRRESHRDPCLMTDTIMGHTSANGHFWTRAAGRYQRGMSLLAGRPDFEREAASLRLYSQLALQVSIMLMQRSGLRTKRRYQAAQPKAVDPAQATQFCYLFLVYHAKLELLVKTTFPGEIEYQCARRMAPTALKHRTIKHLDQAMFRIIEAKNKSHLGFNKTLIYQLDPTEYDIFDAQSDKQSNKQTTKQPSQKSDNQPDNHSEIIDTQSDNQLENQSNDQSTNQSNDQSINQPNNQSNDVSESLMSDTEQTTSSSNIQSVDQSVDGISQSNNQSNNQSDNQSNHQSNNQSDAVHRSVIIRIEPEWLLELRNLADREQRVREALRQVTGVHISRSVQRRRDLASALPRLELEEEQD